jgi:hypothetical protein
VSSRCTDSPAVAHELEGDGTVRVSARFEPLTFPTKWLAGTTNAPLASTSRMPVTRASERELALRLTHLEPPIH